MAADSARETGGIEDEVRMPWYDGLDEEQNQDDRRCVIRTSTRYKLRRRMFHDIKGEIPSKHCLEGCDGFKLEQMLGLKPQGS